MSTVSGSYRGEANITERRMNYGVDVERADDQQPGQTAPRAVEDALFIVVMGVSGTGKSTLGNSLADALNIEFKDGDDLHPKANIDKMSRGEPLNDEDRAPWLEIIRTTAHQTIQAQIGVRQSTIEPERMPQTEKTHADHADAAVRAGSKIRTNNTRPGVVIACSALKKRYRDVLRGKTVSGMLPDKIEAPHQHELPTYFVYLEVLKERGDVDRIWARMKERKGHYMKAGMLESQVQAMESPAGEERVVTVSIDDATEKQLTDALDAFKLDYYRAE
ncbi:carbohydrate kinase [Coniophora puteana RWD-64-598 SS2]|uniref:gluconokinase n=1 Tax=Coniophora puteana (strain RWD-64-598) TaxID=741705 RepID=A0A5M3MUW2_CONPW|nr:carbohydrate kinase [Coniophora puteana RWD-64-598 SS2]EIW82830.1 carbohydrate kinase [Coniophora puteana RWD-64-598 SS2]